VALALIAVGIAGFAPAGAAIADDPVELSLGAHPVSITLRPAAEGRILIEAEIRKPDGTLVSAPRLMATAGESAEISTSVGGRLYKLVVTPAADGSGFAKLEVLEGDKVIDTVVKSIEAPAARMRTPAEPIDLHLAGADLKDVVETFSELTGTEIKLAEGAAGKVTLYVDDTPWDEALVRAVEPLGLKVVFGDGVILIGPPTEKVMVNPATGAFFKRVDPPPPPPPGYERVGGDVKAPQVLTRVDPTYTDEARKERIAGIVILEALLGEDGAVRDVKVLKGLPFGLDQAAADAVRQWTFLPAMKDGKPVPVVFNLTVNFKLDAGKKAEEKQ
jgi:TonB family protein